MPWANRPVAASIGLEYREEAALQQPDSVLGPDIAGFNQSVFVEGRFDTKEVFGEVDIPVFGDMSFVQDFAINGGFRYSDYSTVGGVKSWFVGGNWQVVDDVRIRAQYQAATRAPNISELFLAPGNGFPGVGDPCSGGAARRFGLWEALSPAQQAIVGPRCVADGVPLANVGGGRQTNAQVQLAFSGFGSTLEAEKAKTLTIGAVFTPTFLDGFTATIDYYNIKINNAIGRPTAQALMDECFLFGIASSCSFTNRNGAGNITSFGSLANPVLVLNQQLITQKGIDAAFTYNFDMPGDLGSFRWRFDGTYNLESGAQGAPGSSFFDCAGLYSGVCGEPTPEWKFTTTGSWSIDKLTASLRYSWLSGVDDAATVRYEAYAGKRVSSIGAYGNLDLTLQYDVNDIVALSFGASNILNPDVPLLGDCCNEQANTYPGTYETLGRQFFVGAKLKF
jgi:outer membrane receptor protein involved in Fe transport